MLVMVIGLVVFGPERLQDMARTVGRTVTEFRQASRGLPSLMGDGEPAALEGAQDVPPGEKVMSVVEHIEELRDRIIKGALPILVAAGACFFFSDWILHALKAPAGASFQINAFGPMDGFVLKWKVALYSGLILSSPFWIYQVLAYITPALRPREQRYIFPMLASVAVLLLAGTAFGYALLSAMVRIMIGMFGREINYLPNASAYITFVTFFMLACGIVFELPVALLVLMRLGVLQPETLRRQRKIAYFLLFVFAEIITPVSDPIVGPAIVMAPLVILYEAAILAARFVLPYSQQKAGASNP